MLTVKLASRALREEASLRPLIALRASAIPRARRCSPSVQANGPFLTRLVLTMSTSRFCLTIQPRHFGK